VAEGRLPTQQRSLLAVIRSCVKLSCAPQYVVPGRPCGFFHLCTSAWLSANPNRPAFPWSLARHFNPHCGSAPRHLKRQSRVVNGIRVFVEEDPQRGRTGPAKARFRDITLVLPGGKPLAVTAGLSCWAEAHRLAHGNAAYPRQSEKAARGTSVRWTLVNTRLLEHVRPHLRILRV
jgi:hypothetical protein